MRIASAIITLLICVPAAAQSVYLPLELGNEWTYYTLIDPPGEPYDTLSAGTASVRDSVEIEGRTYMLFGHPNALSDTVRADSSGRIWAWNHGEEHLYFDFTAADSVTYSFPVFGHEMEYTVSVRRNQTVETRAGTFHDCVRFVFDIPEAVDDARSFYFAPEVGIVFTSDGMGQPAWLYEARIGGRMIPSSIIPRERFDLSVEAYPNPSNGAVNVRFVLEQSARVRITVYDVAGRELTSLANGVFTAGQNEVGWLTDGWGAGMYFVVLESDGQRVIRPLGVTR